MRDKIFEAFLKRQYEEGMALASASDLLELTPIIVKDRPVQEYLARFRARGLVRDRDGQVVENDDFGIAIWFPSDYLRRAQPFEVLSWIGPLEVFHPNIRAPFICVGKLAPGTSLVDILYQCFEIITYNKVTMREDDALNPEACIWARNNQERFPVDRRPLKRRLLEIQVQPIEGAVS